MNPIPPLQQPVNDPLPQPPIYNGPIEEKEKSDR